MNSTYACFIVSAVCASDPMCSQNSRKELQYDTVLPNILFPFYNGNDVSDSVKTTKTSSGNLDYSASLIACNDFHDRDEIC